VFSQYGSYCANTTWSITEQPHNCCEMVVCFGMDAQCPRCCSNYQHWQRVLCIVHLASCVHKLAQEFINSWLTGMLLQELWQVATVIALGPTNGYLQHEGFDFMFSLLAMAFGNRFCVSRKGRTGGGGWVHLQGEKKHGHVWASRSFLSSFP